MNDRKAYEKLKEIERERNIIGVGGYKNSRRDKNKRHQEFSEAIRDIEENSDKRKLKGDSDARRI